MKAWDPQSQRLPDNRFEFYYFIILHSTKAKLVLTSKNFSCSNPDRIREFIKHVYIDKRYAIEKLSNKPPRDPQVVPLDKNDTKML